MDNKLSELSKPVAQIYYDEHDSSVMRIGWLRSDEPKNPETLYSQEYVSALLVEMERYKQYAKERDAENESLALTAGRLRVELEAKDKQNKLLMREVEHGKKLRVNMQNNADSLSERITELSQLLAHNIKLADEAEAKLATPVRLPGSFYPDGDIDLPLVVELDEAVEAIRAAGFKIEGED